MATNTVTLEGNVVAEPRIIPLKDDSGIVARLRIAVNRENGRTADFIDCVAFGEEAVLIADRVLKGTHIKLIGSLRSSNWTTKDGAKRYSLDVAADYVQIINRGRAVESDAQPAEQATAEAVAA